MNEKYLKHTIENLIEYADDLTFIDATESDYRQAIETLKIAESMLEFYNNKLYELQEKVEALKVKIGMDMLDDMIEKCREEVTELIGVVL